MHSFAQGHVLHVTTMVLHGTALVIEKAAWPLMVYIAPLMQIHNFGRSFDDDSPNLEFVAPCSVYVVVHGERTNIDLNTIPVRFYSFTSSILSRAAL